MNITYLGKTFNTKHYADISQNECEDIRQNLYIKPSLEDVKDELVNFLSGKNVIKNTNDYFFRDLRWKTRILDHKWTVDEAVQNDDLIRYFVGRIKNNPKTFENHSLIESIKFIFRTGGARVVKMPSNFNPKICDSILNKYISEGDTYFDPSAGWGVRMLCALRNNINYIGLDANDILIYRLKELSKICKEVGFKGNSKLYFGVSEKSNELANVDLVFSSPPYFNLEDYHYGLQSISYGEYNSWKNKFLFPTIDNCFNYLKNGGVFAWNIKNIPEAPMLDDTINYLNSLGDCIEIMDYKNPSRKISDHIVNSDEVIVIYKK